MQLVEQHVIRKRDPRYAPIDEAAFKSKNLYNAALYEMRQAFIHHNIYLSYGEIDKLMQPHEAYKALPAKVAQQVLKQLTQAWKSFREALASYEKDPSKFRERPCLPKYKHKTDGRNMLVYTIQAISRGKRGLRQGIIKPSKLSIEIKTRQEAIDQVRIVPRRGYYAVEVVYTTEPAQASGNPTYYAGIDLGIDNLATVASNASGFVPFIVNGRPVKSINQFYNKRKAALQSKLGHSGKTARIERMTTTRNRRIDHYLHAASKTIIDRLIQAEIGILVIGKNDGWKHEVEMGKRNNQNFVQIPHARFISMLTYKAELQGITVLVTEESYTSKASFLDRDPLPVHSNEENKKPIFSGKRIKRGLYRASDGRLINADVNGAYNIIRKVAPDAFGPEGVEDGKGMPLSLVVHPVRVVVPLTNPKNKRFTAKASNH